MSTTPRRHRRAVASSLAVVLGWCVLLPTSDARAVDVHSHLHQNVAPRVLWRLPSVSPAFQNARSEAERLLGDRPFQMVLMDGKRAVASASSVGTSLLSEEPIASISKAITAITLMRLVELGRATLDQTLGDYFSESLVPAPWRAVTLRQLLSHMSGFVPDRDRWFNDSYTSCFEAFTTTVERDSPTAPMYQYSNTNFCALSLVVGRIAPPSYEDAVARLVFQPLGIKRRGMDEKYASLEGAGGWKMTALDIGRIIASLDPQAAYSPLSEASRSQMIQQTTYNYGLGVWIWDANTFGHSGTLYRARNIAVRLPSGRTVVILTQATFPESGLDLLPIAQRIDAAYTSSCTQSQCRLWGQDPFDGMPTGILGIPLG